MIHINNKAGKYAVLLMLLLIVSSCGGGSSAPNGQSKTFKVNTVLSAGGSITPTSATLAAGEPFEFNILSNPGYSLKSISGCNGTLNGASYSIQGINGNCSITVNFLKNTYVVDSVASSGGSIDKISDEVAHGDSLVLKLVPHTDHQLSSVTGCNGVLSGLIYSIGPILQNCVVSAVFSSLLPDAQPPLEIVRIPVVFHILNGGDTYVSDEEIVSQIQATNTHFRQFNLEELERLSDIEKPYIADIGIQFYLADRDPEGQSHNGIVRLTTQTSVFDIDYKFAQPEFGGSSPWPNNRFINIWVGEFRDRFGSIGLAGRAHIPTFAPHEYIGVSIEESLIGLVDPTFPEFAEGKTLTHELAHFLGLIGHVNGETSEGNNHANLTCDGKDSTPCKNVNLENNFMSTGVGDIRMNMFSLSQQRVMRDWLETGPLMDLYINNLQQADKN